MPREPYEFGPDFDHDEGPGSVPPERDGAIPDELIDDLLSRPSDAADAELMEKLGLARSRSPRDSEGEGALWSELRRSPGGAPDLTASILTRVDRGRGGMTDRRGLRRLSAWRGAAAAAWLLGVAGFLVFQRLAPAPSVCPNGSTPIAALVDALPDQTSGAWLSARDAVARLGNNAFAAETVTPVVFASGDPLLAGIGPMPSCAAQAGLVRASGCVDSRRNAQQSAQATGACTWSPGMLPASSLRVLFIEPEESGPGPAERLVLNVSR